MGCVAASVGGGGSLCISSLTRISGKNPSVTWHSNYAKCGTLAFRNIRVVDPEDKEVITPMEKKRGRPTKDKQ